MLADKEIVINTGPLLAISAAMGDLEVLKTLFNEVIVPFEVDQEIRAGGKNKLGYKEYKKATWLKKHTSKIDLMSFLQNSLDLGEASVIQLALNLDIDTVCIDETSGRQIASLCGLSLTGSIGILIRSQHHGYNFSMGKTLIKMQEKGIWLSERVKNYAINYALKK